MTRRSKGSTRAPWWAVSTKEWIARLVCVSVLVIPLVVSPAGRDTFRLPKELAFRVEILLLLGLIATGLILRELDWKALQWRHPAILLPLAGVAWTGVTTATSTNRTLSVPSFLYAAGVALVFVTTMLAARDRSIRMLHWVFWGGAVNGALYILVASGVVKNPLPLASDVPGHFAATGLLGNANDVGTALLPVAICSTAAWASARKFRAFHVITATLCVAAIVASVSVAALGALAIALVGMAFVGSDRRALGAIALLAVLAGSGTLVHSSARERLSNMVAATKEKQWDELSSGRLTAFAATLEMFRDHPVTGIGPGTFGWQYLPYKIEVSEKHPGVLALSVPSRFNFEEAHSDHLEVLAETGVPGYLLFVAALVLLATGSLRGARSNPGDDERARFARLASLPLALGTGVVALAQYPLQLASSLTTLLFLTALCVSWRGDARSEATEDA
jgi:O-antigen ligase